MKKNIFLFWLVQLFCTATFTQTIEELRPNLYLEKLSYKEKHREFYTVPKDANLTILDKQNLEGVDEENFVELYLLEDYSEVKIVTHLKRKSVSYLSKIGTTIVTKNRIYIFDLNGHFITSEIIPPAETLPTDNTLLSNFLFLTKENLDDLIAQGFRVDKISDGVHRIGREQQTRLVDENQLYYYDVVKENGVEVISEKHQFYQLGNAYVDCEIQNIKPYLFHSGDKGFWNKIIKRYAYEFYNNRELKNALQRTSVSSGKGLDFEVFNDELNRNWNVSIVDYKPEFSYKMQLLNQAGKLIKEYEIRSNQEKIYSGNLVPGLYYLQLSLNGYKTSRKVLKF
ncbi:MAG: T9SS type A sorting domain-containing protein [Saprospiraceae bacterium]|nr:T9SS type A sorting domain-containing protein [Saprospiraceae bacterium]